MPRSPFNPTSDMALSNGSLIHSFVGHFKKTAIENCAADTDGILDGAALTEEAQLITEFLAQPSCAKNITVVGGAAGMTGTVTISGHDMLGGLIMENFVLDGTTPKVGTKAFDRIIGIGLPAQTAEGDTVDVGWGVKLGLPVALEQNTIVKALRDTNTADSGTLTTSSALSTTLYAAGSTDKSLDLWFLVN